MNIIDKTRTASAEKKNLFKNFTAMGIIQILNYVIPFVTLPYLARVLAVDKFGLIFFAQAIMDYFSRFVDFGFNQSGVRELAIKRENPHKVSSIYTSIMFARLGLLLISFLILSVIVFGFEKFRQDWVIYYFTFLSVLGNILLSTWFFQGMEKMKFITYLNVLTRFISLVCIFAFIRGQDDYYLVPLFNSLGILVAGLASVWLAIHHFGVKLYIPKFKEVWLKLRNSSEYFLGNVSIALYQSANAFVLGLCVSTTMVAYYVSAQKIYLAIYFMYIPFYNAFFPYMSKNKDIKFWKKVFKIILFVSVGVSLFILLFSKPIISIFYGPQLVESYKVLRIFAIIVPFHMLAGTMGYPLIGAFGYIKETNQCWIMAGIIHIIALCILYIINRLNIYSVACLYAFSHIFMFLHRVYYINKYQILKQKG